MVRVFLAGEHLNRLLTRFAQQPMSYRGGCFVGHFKLPIGGATAVAVPSVQGRQLVVSVPFKEIKGDLTGGFLLSRLTKTFWGFISDSIEKQARGPLRDMGLPQDTLQVGRHGDVGMVTVSLDRLNQWLATQPVPGVIPVVEEVEFQDHGVGVGVRLLRRSV